jgi:uncharacterized protein YbbC (DUF1343 family)
MGGVAGHAGLFTTAADLARFARMLLNGGELDGVRLFTPQTLNLMSGAQTPPELKEKRGLGWDINTGYSHPRGELFPIGSFGHTGWTGTSLWIDPGSRTFWILLSNRNHPDGGRSVSELRATLGTLAAEAAGVRPDSSMPRAGAGSVLNGLDVLVRQNYAPLKGLRIALVTNPTGQDRHRVSAIDLLKNAPGVMLAALFSPEHGIRGVLDASVPDSVDEQTGLPVHSLYGQNRLPTPEQLRGLDALVFDIQDVGCRFYTYISTMGLCMDAAARAGLRFFVLDRVNPINGMAVEGPVHHGASSFTAFHAIPVRHGMTVGELARLFNAERGLRLNLTVIPLEGWRREAWFDQTGLPWANPSPNMRSLTAATLYSGVGLLETAVSVGRGTDTPFEVIGAPYVDDVKLAAELNGAGLPGVRFVPIRFRPTTAVFKDQWCGGVNILVTDRDKLNAVDVGIELALALQRLYPDQFALAKVNTLLQDQATIDAIRAGKGREEIKRAWHTELEKFRQRRRQYLIY